MKKIIVIAMLLSITVTNAQNNFVSNGNTLISSTGSVSYSMGQMNQLNVETINTFISEGVQQPYEMIENVGLNTLEFQESFSLYPNPATSSFFLHFSNELKKPVSFTLTDVSGRVLESKELNTSISQFNISQLPAAIYYISITSDEQISTITLIKN